MQNFLKDFYKILLPKVQKKIVFLHRNFNTIKNEKNKKHNFSSIDAYRA